MTYGPHTLTVTTAKDFFSYIKDDGTTYGSRRTKTITVYGYRCSCGLSYSAQEGLSSRSLAREVAKEDHENENAIDGASTKDWK